MDLTFLIVVLAVWDSNQRTLKWAFFLVLSFHTGGTFVPQGTVKPL
jgi:hypothetical protein